MPAPMNASEGFFQSGRGDQDVGNFWAIFGRRWPFLVIDGPPLALPGSVLTPSTSARPGLDRPSPDNDLFGPIFLEKVKF